MISGKTLHQHPAELVFATHKHVLPRNKDVIENHQCLVTAKSAVSYIDAASFKFAGITGLTPIDVKYPFCVGRRRKRNRIVRIIPSHADCRHDQNPMRVQRPGLMCFRAMDHDPVRPLFHDTNEHVRVGLFMRRQVPVPFGVGHRAIHSKVLILNHFQEFSKPLMILGPQLLIHFIGYTVHCVDRIHADTALKAGSCFLAKQSLHLDFLYQVFGVAVQMAKPIDFFTGQMRSCGHQILILRLLRQFIGHHHGIHRRPNDGVIDRVCNFFPHQINVELHFSQTLFIFLRRFHCHCNIPL